MHRHLSPTKVTWKHVEITTSQLVNFPEGLELSEIRVAFKRFAVVYLPVCCVKIWLFKIFIMLTERSENTSSATFTVCKSLHLHAFYWTGFIMAPLVRTRQTEKRIDGISTQVVCTEFSNYIFIVLTQYGKIGTLVSVTPDSRSSDISTSMLTTKVLLGKDEVLVHLIC